MANIIKKFKEPINTLTHLVPLLFFIPLGILLIIHGVKLNSVAHVVGFSIFAVSLILLYSASSFYHMLDISDKINKILKKIDHTMVFVLIAGTYTPICLVTLKGPWGYTLLIIVWACAIFGTIYKMFFINASRKISSILYIIMGWIVVIAFVPLFKSLDTIGFILLFLGGISYTLGGIIYAIKKPNFKYFNFHEVFHIFVVIGSLFHIVLMFFYI